MANLMYLSYNGGTRTFNSCYPVLLDSLISGLNNKVIDKKVGRSIFNHLKKTSVYVSPLFVEAIALSRYERFANWLRSMENITNVTSIGRGGSQSILKKADIQIYAESIYSVSQKQSNQTKKKILHSLSSKVSAGIGFYILYKIFTTSEQGLQTQSSIAEIQTHQRVAEKMPESEKSPKVKMTIENSPNKKISNRKKITFRRGKRKSSLKNGRVGKTVYFHEKVKEWNQENDISDNESQRLLE